MLETLFTGMFALFFKHYYFVKVFLLRLSSSRKAKMSNIFQDFHITLD